MASANDDELLDKLQSFDESIRKVALQSLALQGESAAAYAHEVAALLKDDNAEVRRAAAVALGKIGRSAGAQARSLAASLRDEDPRCGRRRPEPSWG